MSALRISPAAATAAALAIGAALAACGASPARRSSEGEPLRTADIVHAPRYEAASAPTASAAAAPEIPKVASAPAPAATVTAIAQPAPAAAVAPLAEVPQPGAAPPAPAVQGAAPVTAVAAQARWVVQVGVFAVPANAQKVRARVESRLAQSALAPAQRVVRVERIGDRSHVLVGDLPDRAAAQALAAQLRSVLNQDVVVLRRQTR